MKDQIKSPNSFSLGIKHHDPENLELEQISDEFINLNGFSEPWARKNKSTANLKNSRKKNKRSVQETATFSYIYSHDLQEPLRKIQTFSSRILEKEEKNLSESGRDYFARMQKAASRMQKIIDDLLEFAKIDHGKYKVKSCDLLKLIKEVEDEFKKGKETFILHLNIENCIAEVNPWHFKQLVRNLISNALKFAHPERAVEITIHCEIKKGNKLLKDKLEAQKKYCHIQVLDNGIGFESHFNERIFEMFQRLHSKEEYDGTGIGLAICKKIVENHRGVITAKGVKNQGAIFDVFIPTAQ